MKAFFKNSSITVLAVLTSVTLFILIFQLLSSGTQKHKTEDLDINISHELEVVTPCIDKCVTKGKSGSMSERTCLDICLPEKPSSNKFLSDISIISYLNGTRNITGNKDTTPTPPDIVIKLIYLLIWFALFSQILLSFQTVFYNQRTLLKRNRHQIVDSMINSPPILGVVGTIYSFAVYTTNLDNGADLIEGFKSSFFDASFTTIMAGFIYVVNLYLSILILKKK